MFSKFKIEKPEYVLYKRGRTHFEAERSVVSLPLLEAYDERLRHLLAENNQLRASKIVIEKWQRTKFIPTEVNLSFSHDQS